MKTDTTPASLSKEEFSELWSTPEGRRRYCEAMLDVELGVWKRGRILAEDFPQYPIMESVNKADAFLEQAQAKLVEGDFENCLHLIAAAHNTVSTPSING